MNADRLESAPEGELRTQVSGLLAEGLCTDTAPIPKDHLEVEAITALLRNLPPAAVTEKLVMAGYQDHPHKSDGLRCLECMYYSSHRRWCVLPEIDLPAEQDWWCRLWRV